MYFITFFKQILKKNSFYTKYRQYKFSKLVKVVTRTKAKFSINHWLHLYFSLKLHNIQNEHFSVLKKWKKYFKFNGNVLFWHYGSILDSDKSCNLESIYKMYIHVRLNSYKITCKNIICQKCIERYIKLFVEYDGIVFFG